MWALSEDRYAGRIVPQFVMKFPYNVCSDWVNSALYQRTEHRLKDSNLAFKFLLWNFGKFDPS